MDRSERFIKIKELLNSKKSVAKAEFIEALEVSESTFKRDIEYLRDRMRIPIIWDRSKMGYRIDVLDGDQAKYELPGLWFNASEIHALLVMEYLLENLQPGLLSPHLEPLRTQIGAIIEKGASSTEDFHNRIRLLPLGSRTYDLNLFGVISNALLSRKRLNISHFHRERNESTNRDVSPQRLAHYRDNWYLDTWCHFRKKIRTFSLEAITNAQELSKNAKEVSKKRLDTHLASSYGIYSGKPSKLAIIKFTPKMARWVSSEIWHPKQVTYSDKNGHYYIKIPYNDARELVMDILKYGDEVEVIGPTELKAEVSNKLKQALSLYQ